MRVERVAFGAAKALYTIGAIGRWCRPLLWLRLNVIEPFHQDHKTLIWWIVSASMLLFVGSLLVVPWLVVQMPTDYFAFRTQPESTLAQRHPIVRSFIWGVRNLFGVTLILIGLVMLVLPGQGLLTIAVGLVVAEFPGKHRLERRVVRVPAVLKSINWLRHKAHRPPLVFETD